MRSFHPADLQRTGASNRGADIRSAHAIDNEIARSSKRGRGDRWCSDFDSGCALYRFTAPAAADDQLPVIDDITQFGQHGWAAGGADSPLIASRDRHRVVACQSDLFEALRGSARLADQAAVIQCRAPCLFCKQGRCRDGGNGCQRECSYRQSAYHVQSPNCRLHHSHRGITTSNAFVDKCNRLADYGRSGANEKGRRMAPLTCSINQARYASSAFS